MFLANSQGFEASVLTAIRAHSSSGVCGGVEGDEEEGGGGETAGEVCWHTGGAGRVDGETGAPALPLYSDSVLPG